jgi:hypothetical protein
MRIVWLAVWSLGALCIAYAQYPFTYQGYLRQNGNPASGAYDFQFSLWTSQTGGTQVGATQTRTGVAVREGFFTVTLDFGNVWDGQPRFLQIAVRPASTGNYTVLMPRIRIVGTPYALYAYKADWFGLANIPEGFADGIDDDTRYSAGAGLVLEGTTFRIAPGGVVSSMLANSSVTSDKLADGAVTTPKIANGAITSAKLADGSVLTAKIGDNQVTDPKIASVSWSKLIGVPSASGDVSGTYPNLTVTGLQGRAVSSALPSDGYVLKWNASTSQWVPAPDADGTEYQAGDGLQLTGNIFSIRPAGVVSTMLAPNAVTSDKLVDGAVLTSKIGDNQVTDPKIASVSWSKLIGVPSASGDVSGTYPNLTVTGLQGRAVSSALPSDGYVLKWNASTSQWVPAPDAGGTEYQAGDGLQLTGNIFSIRPAGVVSTMLAPNAVTSDKLADGAVTSLKIANGAVTAAKLADGAVLTSKIGDNQVTDPKIASVSWSKLIGVPSASGDVSGTYPNLTVTGLQGRAVSSVSPSVGQVLKWNGSSWAPATDETGGGGFWSASGSHIYNTNSGNVGIGTSNPVYRLDIVGDVRWSGSLQGGSVPWARITGAPDFLTSVSVSPRLTGSGTPGSPLDLASQGASVGQVLKWNGSAWVPQNDERGGLTLPFSGSAFVSGSGASVFSITNTATSGINTTAYFVTNSTDGTAMLAVATATSGNNTGVYGASLSPTGFAGYFVGRGYFSGNVGIGTSPATDARLVVNGTARVSVLEITGADIAEKFPTTETLEPGTVVEIDPDNPGHLRKARGAYNKRVAGVVAGANGLSKGIILGNLEGSENHTPIAISGRVWVYADATHEAIEPGDFLTTSETPGYAMKATDLPRAQGSILGKAMTRLEKGKTGMVLVLVNLQ